MKIRFPLFLLIGMSFSCARENVAPDAKFTCTPPEGNVKTIFDLDATASEDPDGLKTLLTYRWDANDDGEWDMDFGPWKIYQCSFSQPGTYTVRLEVKDSFDGITSISCTVRVEGLRSITDPRDRQVYPVVKIGSYWWFARNLNIGKTLNPHQQQSNNGIIEKYIFPGPDPDSLNGGLYTWAEVMVGGTAEGATGICPPGWHVPSSSDWNNMLSVFRSESSERSFTYRISNVRFVPDQLVTHDNYQQAGAIWRLLRDKGSTGFDAVMVGYRNPDGEFDNRDYYFPGNTASFWTSSTYGIYQVRIRMYDSGTGEGDIFRFPDNPQFAFSVRCVKESL